MSDFHKPNVPELIWCRACHTRGPRPYRSYARLVDSMGRKRTVRISPDEYDYWLNRGVPVRKDASDG